MARARAPRVFRVLLPAKDLKQSRKFYEKLLAAKGRKVAAGRYYFDCGPVLLGLLDYSAEGANPTPPTEAIYFSTDDLEGVYQRARTLGCLPPGLIHNDPASPLGKIVMRPWGERSFYADDPTGNPLCFVDERTVFTGTPDQLAALEGRLKQRRTEHPRPSAVRSGRASKK